MLNTPPGRFSRSQRSERVPLRLRGALLGDERARRALQFGSSGAVRPVLPVVPWTEGETKALVEFVLFYGKPDAWPKFSKGSKFWSEAAEFLGQRTDGASKRTGSDLLPAAGACRFRVIGKLTKSFLTPAHAERHFFGMEEEVEVEEVEQQSTSEATQPHTSEASSQTNVTFPCLDPVVAKACIKELVAHLPESDQLDVLSDLLSTHAAVHCGITLPEDFLKLTLDGSKHLKSCNRSNIIYGLAKGVGRMRGDGSDSRLPARRMPMGLLEYTINFFNADNLKKVGQCPEDYRSWQRTMYTIFGNKWANLHNGPMWSVVSLEQETGMQEEGRSLSPVDARVNIPGLSSRSIRSDIAASPFTRGAEIQTHALDEAKRQHPNSWFWMKGDGCDIIPGLGESTRLEWTGDVDVNDGKLQEQYAAYQERLEFVESIKLGDPLDRLSLETRLKSTEQQLVSDLTFLCTALEKAQMTYEEKQQSGKTPEKTLFGLAWQVKDLEDLIKEGRRLIVELGVLLDKAGDPECDLIKENIARRLTTLRKELTTFVKNATRQQRTAATHVFVMMISPEERSRKPYAIPVQCLPYKGLKDRDARMLANHLIEEMTNRGMKVAGFTTNGEFNSLRWQGNTRPLSILQVRTDARAKYTQKGYRALMAMLTPTATEDGSVAAKKSNPAVPPGLLRDILQWKSEGANDLDVITRLRQHTVPEGYIPHTWQRGKTETPTDMLRSVLAQMEYTHKIREWDEKGVPFRTRAYVPEVHPLTGTYFHEREDEAHVLKRIAGSLRNGGPKEMQVERFLEAAKDPNTQLTYHALVGSRKQSVLDAERMFGAGVLEFMENKAYAIEAEYVRVIRNWRRACDERGLSENERSRYNQDILGYILDDLMPWHSQPGMHDYSLLEVNRDIHNICGFTRETLSALLANIESREWRRQFNIEHGIPPEHPRSSTSDDVECFFSMMRDQVGRDFTHKQVTFAWRKVCGEFTKRLSPDLPFYYHTSTHHRFYIGEMPSFSDPPSKPKKQQRVPRRELLSSGIGGRVSLVQRGAGSVRTTYHNVPVELPPPPTHARQHLYEHAYSTR